MSRRPKGSLPALQHHKPSGRARVTINGRDHWLGKWGSSESRLAAGQGTAGRAQDAHHRARRVRREGDASRGRGRRHRRPHLQRPDRLGNLAPLSGVLRYLLPHPERRADEHLWERPAGRPGAAALCGRFGYASATAQGWSIRGWIPNSKLVSHRGAGQSGRWAWWVEQAHAPSRGTRLAHTGLNHSHFGGGR